MQRVRSSSVAATVQRTFVSDETTPAVLARGTWFDFMRVSVFIAPQALTRRLCVVEGSVRTFKSALRDASGSFSEDNICWCKSVCDSSASLSFCTVVGSFLGDVVELIAGEDRGDEVEVRRVDARGERASSFSGDIAGVAAALSLFFLSFGLGGILRIWL